MIPHQSGKGLPEADVIAHLISELAHGGVAQLIIEGEASEAAAFSKRTDMNALQDDPGKRSMRQSCENEVVTGPQSEGIVDAVRVAIVGLNGNADRNRAIYAVVQSTRAPDDVAPEQTIAISGVDARRKFLLREIAGVAE